MPRHPDNTSPQSQKWIDSVQEARADLGLTLKSLAQMAAIHPSMLTKALNVNYGATAKTVAAINETIVWAKTAKDKAALESETAGDGFIRENSEPLTDADRIAGETDRRPLPGDLPTAISVTPEPMKDGSMFLPAGTEVKYCPGVGWSKPQPVDDTPHLSCRVADLAEDQVRFWVELAEATKRLTAVESRLGHAIDGSEGVVSRFTQRLAAVDARLDAANDSLHNRQETNEYSLNQLAKSVERIDRDEATNSERIDNLREDLTAWAGIFDMLNGAIGKHKDQIGLGQIVTEAHSQRLNTCESRLSVLEAGGASLAEWGRNDSDAIELLRGRVESIDNAMTGTIDVLNRHRSGISSLTNRLDATIEMQDDHQKRLSALEGHPSGGESPLWDALDVLTTDVKELRSSYVNRPWAARIEETVEALAAEVRILHDYTRQDNSLMLAHADIVRRLNALELNNTDAFALRVIELLAGRLGS